MKNIFVAYSLLIFALVGCGENNTGYNYNANACQYGYTWNNGSCVPNNVNGFNTGLNGYNNGLNGINNAYPMTNNPMQGCTVGYVWNGTACVPQNINGTTPQIAVLPEQNCATGQYFNGSNCALTMNYQGACPAGQINTAAYGCIQTASQCQNQYAYLNGSSCVPAQVTLPSCGSCQTTQFRRNGRVMLCSGANGAPKKIKFNKDGSIKKMKW